ncbi:divisome protein SepX/GlpR [Nocardioides sp. GXQ0305]|uniref:divisome protein SepX/GlpR n=1 Tax=Nocardioides sp. GXQ0305 TaxID=3423912 RepID=UPI003D7CE8E5
MDLSALIFVALAVAWAVYLVPKALKHHDDVVRSRSVDRFSHTMRVLARREPVDRRSTRLVVSPGRQPAPPVVTTKARAAGPAAGRPERESARRAARRRRRVLGTILLGLLATGGVAAFGLIAWWWVAVPATLLVAWLVACRLMVRRERNQRFDSSLGHPEEPADDAVAADGEPTDDALDDTSQTPAVTDPSLWDPMPVTLPTYVTAPAAARRTVRTIDLDSTGVWTSGRTEADTALAREADEAERLRRSHADQRRATGS